MEVHELTQRAPVWKTAPRTTLEARVGTIRSVGSGLIASVTSTVAAVVFCALAVTFICEMLLAIYAIIQGSWSAFTAGSLLGLAASALAGAAGFLFGLPRYSTVVAIPAERGTSSSSVDDVVRRANSSTRIFAPSNNLEQVSDWLTKLLLGVGLVQFESISQWLLNLIARVAPALSSRDPTGPSARIVAGSILVIYSILGLLFVYLSTTLWYRSQLERVERGIESIE